LAPGCDQLGYMVMRALNGLMDHGLPAAEMERAHVLADELRSALAESKRRRQQLSARRAFKSEQ
jgi:hypothetical protein